MPTVSTRRCLLCDRVQANFVIDGVGTRQSAGDVSVSLLRLADRVGRSTSTSGQ
ncbi:unnamed protein product [Ectocarpus sp. 12 AP-2014]